MIGLCIGLAYLIVGLLTSRRVYVNRVRSGKWQRKIDYNDHEVNVFAVMLTIPVWPLVLAFMAVTAKPVAPAKETAAVERRIAELERELGLIDRRAKELR